MHPIWKELSYVMLVGLLFWAVVLGSLAYLYC